MKTSQERILTTHTGSLPRPAALVELMYARHEGHAVDANQLAEATATATAEVVARQQQAGVDVVSDGEMSKPSYATYVTERLTGFGGTSKRPQLSDILEYPNVASAYFSDPGVQRLNMNRPACDAPVRPNGEKAFRADIERYKAALQAAAYEEAFLTAASPGLISMFLGNSHYATEEEFLRVVADAMRPEYEAIVDAGFVLQLDCPDMAMTRHREFADAPLKDFLAYLRLHIEVLNDSLANIQPDRLRLHVCWGNYPGPHHRDVALSDIVELLLAARPSALVFEAANPRHEHEWKVFQNLKLPAGKVLIPGVIGSMNNYIEHSELIAQRIVRFANLVGRENIIAGSDCGFGTFVGVALVDPDIAWAKLASLAEGARLASRELW